MLHQSGKKPAAVKTAGRFSEKLSVNPFANTGSDAEAAKGGKAALRAAAPFCVTVKIKNGEMLSSGNKTGGKIRIMHVVQASGGVDRYLRMLFKYMNPDRFENILVCSAEYRKNDYEGLVSHFEMLDMGRDIIPSDHSFVRKIRTLIKKYKPDIVYAHSSKAGALARWADIGIKNVCVYNPHGWAFNMRISAGKKKLYRFIEKAAAHFCDKIICISEFEKRSALENRICKDEKLQVIYNGVDIEAYKNGMHAAAEKENFKIPRDAFVVGMVSRIAPQKAPDIFVKAASLIKEKIPGAFFIIVGGGEMEEEVRAMVREAGLGSSFLITGWVDEPMPYIEIFDVAMLLSRWEGFGLVLAEYMIAERPIVATGTDAVPEIVADGKTGILVDVDDPEAVCAAVLKLYENEALRERLGRAGTAEAERRFNVKRVAAEHEALFEELCG